MPHIYDDYNFRGESKLILIYWIVKLVQTYFHSPLDLLNKSRLIQMHGLSPLSPSHSPSYYMYWGNSYLPWLINQRPKQGVIAKTCYMLLYSIAIRTLSLWTVEWYRGLTWSITVEMVDLFRLVHHTYRSTGICHLNMSNSSISVNVHILITCKIQQRTWACW